MKKILIPFLCIGVMILIGCKKEDNAMSVEEIYREVLSQYLLETLELEKYDEQLSNSEMGYIPNKGEDITEPQNRDRMVLKYIYLRNELHTERLSDEEVNILLTEAKNGNLYSDKSKEVIINSFANVIPPKKFENEEDKKIETTYDMGMNPDFVTMDSLVLMIGTMSEFDEEGNYVDLPHEEKKKEELVKFCNQMERNLEGRLGDVPVRVLLEK